MIQQQNCLHFAHYTTAWGVRYDGTVSSDHVASENRCVRPAITIYRIPHTLSVTSEDESKGTVAITAGSGLSGETVTVVATPAEGYLFKGWYVGEAQVSDLATFTFTMPGSDYSLIAHFWTQAEKEVWNSFHGVIPTLSNGGKTVTYGLYPQTRVSDNSIVSALNAIGDSAKGANGWYLYAGEYYAKVSAKPYESGYKFDDGATIVNGTIYWFKCEPIKWDVLSETDGEYYVLSDVLLDTHRFHESEEDRYINGKRIYANNYEYSDIREWLNGDFYNSAFALGNDAIQTTTVDNSKATTGSSTPYACADTQDKVFLPSYKDYVDSAYGFSTSTDASGTRECKTTDWTRATGARYETSASYLYNGSYWTRSPANLSSIFVLFVRDNGSIYDAGNGVRDARHSVRPCLSLRIA